MTLAEWNDFSKLHELGATRYGALWLRFNQIIAERMSGEIPRFEKKKLVLTQMAYQLCEYAQHYYTKEVKPR